MINIDAEINIDNWFDYPNMYQAIAFQPDMLKLAEVGCWKGHSISYLAKLLLSTNKKFELYAIDIWDEWKNWRENCKVADEAHFDEIIQNLYKIYNRNLEINGVRKHIVDVKKPSVEAVKDFEDGYFDFVYIDADHTYNAVKRDIDAWFPKVRVGGIIGGHDYFQPTCGVKQAVDEKFSKVGTIDSAWYYTKR